MSGQRLKLEDLAYLVKALDEQMSNFQTVSKHTHIDRGAREGASRV